MKLISLREASSADVDQIGGKARNLPRLADAGMAVPDGRIVPADVFRAHLAGHALDGRAAAVAQDPVPDPCQRLREDVVAANVDQDMARALSQLLAAPHVRERGVPEL